MHDAKDNKLNFVGVEGFDKPVASRYAATKPNLLDWFADYNQGREYPDQIRPFTFMLSFQLDEMEFVKARNSGDTEALSFASEPRPASPFETDVIRAAKCTFDRGTGKPVKPEWLRTYENTLAGYHLRDEAKFLGGNKTQRGKLARRHVDAFAIQYIGKEAHDWEEASKIADQSLPAIRPNRKILNVHKSISLIAGAQKSYGVRALCLLSGVGDRSIREILHNRVENADAIERLVRSAFLLSHRSNANGRRDSD